MNKKGMFVAFLAVFLAISLSMVFFFLSKNSEEIVRVVYTPTDVLNNHFDIKEYEFDLNQEVKYCSFEAFDNLAKNSGFFNFEGNSITGSAVQVGKCDTWTSECNPLLSLEENFKNYFFDCFEKPFDVEVELINNKFVISGKAEKKIFENFNVRTEIIPEFNYVLDYDVSIFEDLYKNCNILSCDKLEEKNCKILKNKCSSEDKYIKMEYDLKDNGFINPKIVFRVTKPGVF